MRVLKERKQVKHVENDLRQLGSYVKEKPPFFETSVQISQDKFSNIMLELLALKHGFSLSYQGKLAKLHTPPAIPLHKQAVWHLFVAFELSREFLNTRVVISRIEPLSEIILPDGKADSNININDTSPGLYVDPSAIVFFNQAQLYTIQQQPDAGLMDFVKLDQNTVQEILNALNKNKRQTVKRINNAG